MPVTKELIGELNKAARDSADIYLKSGSETNYRMAEIMLKLTQIGSINMLTLAVLESTEFAKGQVQEAKERMVAELCEPLRKRKTKEDKQ